MEARLGYRNLTEGGSGALLQAAVCCNRSYSMSKPQGSADAPLLPRHRSHLSPHLFPWLPHAPSILLPDFSFSSLHPLQYEVVVLYCQLDRPLTSAGGYLKAQIDSEVSYPFREEATEVR